MKIAYLTSKDPKDRASWSGIHYYIAQALEKHCGEVFYLGPVKPKIKIISQLYNKLARLSLRKSYYHRSNRLLAKKYAQIFGRKLSEQQFDLIFAVSASTEIAFLETKLPIVYVADSTFALMRDYYPGWYSRLLNQSIRTAHAIEEMAIKKASLLLFPSQWAAQSATADYHADKSKVKVIPFGANLEEVPSQKTVQAKKKTDKCRLLFLGVEWQRKGGHIAFETLLQLAELDIEAELIVCGCQPPLEFSHKALKVIPFLDKNDAAQRQELSNLMLTCDFLLLPTRSECYGIVFCEASAFGLPVITTNTGGVAGAVRHGENGFMLPVSAKGTEYAKLISLIYRDDDQYYELRNSSRMAFDKRLNWDTWATETREVVNELL